MAYLVMTSPPGEPSRLFEAALDDLERQGWRRVVEAFGLVALVEGALAPEVAAIKDGLKTEGVLVGRIFDRRPDALGRARRADLAGLASAEPLSACRVLCDQAFGGYVCVLAQDRAAPLTFRGPNGALDVFTWRREDLILIGDTIPTGLAAPRDLAIDWQGLGAILAQSVRAEAQPPLCGVLALDPGVCRVGASALEDTRLWSPAQVVRRGLRRPAVEELRAAVDLAITAELDDADSALCEISGGLDSAIIAGSLAAVGRPARLAVNFWRDQLEADERLYAQSVADLTGTPLRAIRREVETITAESFAVSALSVRPTLAAADIDYERLIIDAIGEAGAQVVVTGHGGDTVFYQLGAAQIAADLLSGAPCEGSRLARLGDLARRTRRSVWSLAWEAITGRAGTGSPQKAATPNDLVRVRPVGPAHPWQEDRRGISPAKQLQIAGLVGCLGHMAPTARSAVARIAHPLLAQPVVELCLRTPIPILSSGEGERTFARGAFAGRIPAVIAERRSKGDITTNFGRSTAASVPFLRSFLLDGRLVAEGLLDRDALDAALSSEALIWRNTYGPLFLAAGLEAWVAHWEGRIGEAAAYAAGVPSASARKAKARA